MFAALAISRWIEHCTGWSIKKFIRTARRYCTIVQIVHSSRRSARDIKHLGSAYDDAELEVLKAAARYRLTAGQAELDLGLDFAAAMPTGGRGGPLPITRRGWGIWWMS